MSAMAEVPAMAGVPAMAAVPVIALNKTNTFLAFF